MKIWVGERNPKSLNDMIDLLHTYNTYHPHVRCERGTAFDGRGASKLGSDARDGRGPVKREKSSETGNWSRGCSAEVTCFKCHQKGHYTKEYRAETFRLEYPKLCRARFHRKGAVNDNQPVEMRVDTGCSRMTVRRDVVPDVLLKEEKVQA